MAGRAILIRHQARLTTHLLLDALVHLRQATHAFLNDLVSYSTDTIIFRHLVVALPMVAILVTRIRAITVAFIDLIIPLVPLLWILHLVE